MRGFLFAYCIGLVAVIRLPDLQLAWSIAAVGCGLLALLVLLQRVSHSGFSGAVSRSTLLLCAAAWCGFAWHILWASQTLHGRLPAALEGQDLWVTGHVTSLPAASQAATQFQFYIDSSEVLAEQDRFLQRLVLLNSYQQLDFAPGQHWRLLVRLNRPHGFANAGGFDYEAFLLQQGIVAKGYVRDHPDNQLLGVNGNVVQRLRFTLRARLQDLASQLPSSGILLALALGDRSGLTQDEWDLMSATGTNHLFVISGLHIGLVATAMYWLASTILRLLPAISLYCPRQKVALMLALVAALIYSLLAGFTLPTQRAFIMTAVFVLGQLGSKAMPVSLRFLLALAIILTLNPLAILSSGFWLSFVAVAALLLWINTNDQSTLSQSSAHRVVNFWLRPQLIVFVALLPFLALWTGQVSLLSPVINVVAIPLVGLLVVPLTLLGLMLLLWFAPMALWVLQVSDYVLQLLLSALNTITAHSAWSVVTFAALSMPVMVCLVLATLLLLAPLRRQWQWLALPLCLPVLLPAQQKLPLDTADIHILDVGQGLSVIIKTANHVLVYDTGAQLSPEFDLGTAVVVPVLRHLGQTQVDALVVSHFDNDHAGGLRGLLTQMPVAQLLSSQGDVAAQAIRGIDPLPTESALAPALILRSCQAKQQWQWDGVTIKTMHPAQGMGFAAYTRDDSHDIDDANNFSCVVQIQVGEHRLLLPGDIERQSELKLALRFRQELRSDVLLAPHHGSNTSSTYGFLKQVRPAYVIYTSGYRNSFGHPTDRVRNRYLEFGSTEYITHTTGMLTFRFIAGQPLSPPDQYRQLHPRYWY